MTKYVFVTGGVVSSLGKGIAAASLAAILESRGIKVTLIKLDPYINVDPGTMSPFQHGEVFVTEDGAETDLDLGHYERFSLDPDAKRNNFTTGQIYERVIKQGAPRRLPRRHGAGDPAHHRRDQGEREAPRARTPRSAIVEIGGTVGDIESLPFLEAIRQMGIEDGPQQHLLHPPDAGAATSPAAGEIKTKPTQHSVKELREIGIQPDVVLCRTDRPIPEDERRKIALFTNVARAKRHLRLGRRLDLQDPADAARAGAGRDRLPQARPRRHPADLSTWEKLGLRARASRARGRHRDGRQVRRPAGLVQVAHRGAGARRHPHPHQGPHPLRRLRADRVEAARRRSRDMDAILVPGGFGKRGIEGKIAADPLRARERRALPRHLPRHAARDDRVRAQRVRARGREQHRVRPRHAASGDRADHRVAGPRRDGGAARRAIRPRRHHAPGRAARRS